MQALGAVPALVALLDRDLAAYHGVEHKAIAAYEQGVDDPAAVPKEHDRCGSNLIAPMMLLSAGGTVLLERLVEQPGPAGPRRRRPRRRLDRGRDVRLERPPPRRPAGRGLPHARAARSSAWSRPRSRRPSSSRSGSPRWPRSCGSRAPAGPDRRRHVDCRRVFGRIDHIGVAVEDLDAAHRALREELRDGARPPRDGRVAGRRGGPARRRRRPRRAAGAARPGHRRSASSSSARARACTTSPTRSTTSTRRWSGSAPPASS